MLISHGISCLGRYIQLYRPQTTSEIVSWIYLRIKFRLMNEFNATAKYMYLIRSKLRPALAGHKEETL